MTDRSSEIRLTRVYDAPVSAVWDAWTITEQVERWWGPRGFTLTTHSKDLRPGGAWRYTMHGPDGTDYPNITTYFVVEPRKKLVYDHGATDDSPPLFRVTATFSEESGQTTLDLVFALSSPEAAAETARFIRRAGGEATWDRLAEHLAHTSGGLTLFVINRAFDAPIERVFAMWTDPEQLAKWLPPPGSSMRFHRAVIAVGESTLFEIRGPHGAMRARAEYLRIDAPRQIVYAQQFVDESERPTPPPDTSHWPSSLLMTARFAEEAPDRTRVTVTTEAHASSNKHELDALRNERPGMTLGWTASFDTLEALLVPRPTDG